MTENWSFQIKCGPLQEVILSPIRALRQDPRLNNHATLFRMLSDFNITSNRHSWLMCTAGVGGGRFATDLPSRPWTTQQILQNQSADTLRSLTSSLTDFLSTFAIFVCSGIQVSSGLWPVSPPTLESDVSRCQRTLLTATIGLERETNLLAARA